MRNCRDLLFGARVGGTYQGAVQGPQEAEAGVQGQPGLNSEMLSSQGRQIHLEFSAVAFHFSYLLVKWEVLNSY